MDVDGVSLFAIIVVSVSWFYWKRTPDNEPLARVFFATLMALGAMIGILGYALRAFLPPLPPPT